ncbi:short-subunit dehydrogenase [Mucilaginibacter gracilis]|uniref:Short-subunit dehydrogenase n=1 Tax=Mucilaginibacter gracilis TaxID=423350 RepID=A0A495J0F9_9SPHI|nr:SDR family NAD(P)-dependent oxidoreductase [Mucilaginibacter gracilis]RKR82111.1 short-subunit dehydrogenase [Mucilaginibacter gracilis]
MTKKVIIVGASSGIGKALALQLAERDYLIAITGRRTELLAQLSDQYPDKILYSEIDNTQTDTLEMKLEKLKEQLGGLDLLILSSGVGNINESLSFAIEKATIDLNVTAFTMIAGWAFKTFQKQGYGHLAAITSIAGLAGSHLAPAYNASKAFEINYLKGLRKNAGQLKLPIIITDIRPGFVDTAMAKGEGLFWVAPADKAAAQIVAAINNHKRVTYITKRWTLVALLLKLVNL